MEIKYFSKGNFANSLRMLARYKSVDTTDRMERAGQIAEMSLMQNTPVDTGELAIGWKHTVEKGQNGLEMSVHNNSHQEYDLVVGLEYGHGTGTGGYVQPTHFVTLTMDSIEDRLSEILGGVIEDG